MWECMDLEVRSYIVSTGVIIVQYHLVHIRDNLVKVAAVVMVILERECLYNMWVYMNLEVCISTTSTACGVG